MALIEYENKVALNENPSIADINKVKADDMNEIKSVVNGNEADRQAMIVNTKSSSTTNTYSCDFINGTVLYNSAGEIAPVTLSSNVSNFSRIDIYASVDNPASYGLSKTTIFPSLSTKGMLILASAGNGWASIHCYRCKVSGTTFEKETDAVLGSGGSWSAPTTDNIKICKIIGYK